MATRAEVQAELQRRQQSQPATVIDIQAEIARRQQPQAPADSVQQTQQAIQAGGLQPFFEGLPIETVQQIKQQSQRQGAGGFSEQKLADIERLRITNPERAAQIEEISGPQALAIGAGRGLTSVGRGAQQLAFTLARTSLENNLTTLDSQLKFAQQEGNFAEEERVKTEIERIQGLLPQMQAGEAGIAEQEREEQALLDPLRQIRPTAVGAGEIVGQALPAAAAGILAAPPRLAAPVAGAIESQLLPATGETEEARERERLANLALGAGVGAVAAPLISAGGRTLGGAVTPEQQTLIAAGEQAGARVLTTDIAQPEGFIAGIVQSFGEKIPLVGTGGIRKLQQQERQQVVKDVADEFGLELETPLANDIVQSLKNKSADTLERARVLRNDAIDQLTPAGPVPNPKTTTAIQNQIDRQQRIGPLADQTLLNRLENTREALQDADFSVAAQVRSSIIDDIKALERADDRRNLIPLKIIKSAIDEDMLKFARRTNRDAAANWLRGNREFSEELTNIKGTELKRILNTGDATPENVMTILRGNKPTQLNRLARSLNEDGRKAARAAIVRDALESSGFFRGDVNPSKFATELGRSKNLRAVNAFFKGDQKKLIEGTRRLLDATRRAQQAGVVPPTGIQTLPPLGAIAAKLIGGVTALFTVGSVGAVARIYESKAMRGALLRLSNTKPNSPAERKAINAIVPILVSASEKVGE